MKIEWNHNWRLFNEDSMKSQFIVVWWRYREITTKCCLIKIKSNSIYVLKELIRDSMLHIWMNNIARSWSEEQFPPHTILLHQKELSYTNLTSRGLRILQKQPSFDKMCRSLNLLNFVYPGIRHYSAVFNEEV